MKRIALDMDGVLADVYNHFIKMHFEETGESLTIEALEGKTELEAFPHIRKHVNSTGFFRDLKLIPGCQQYVEQLNQQYELFIVSAATEFPLSLSEKQIWLNKYFPFLTWRQMVFCGSKEIIRADIMIDDHFKNLDHFPGETILFTQPHNKFADAGRHRRVTHWEEVGQILL